jgi:hypothetical protein
MKSKQIKSCLMVAFFVLQHFLSALPTHFQQVIKQGKRI